MSSQQTSGSSVNALYRNRGIGLERALEALHMFYANQDIALINKVEVPKIWDRRAGIMKYARKTGFDYQGVICATGKVVVIEAKQTKEPRLHIDPKGKGGLKVHQIDALIRYGESKAFSGVVWSCTNEDTTIFIDWMFLRNFMRNIYGKELHRGRPVKSIMLSRVRDTCPSVDRKGLPDYLMALGDR